MCIILSVEREGVEIGFYGIQIISDKLFGDPGAGSRQEWRVLIVISSI